MQLGRLHDLATSGKTDVTLAEPDEKAREAREAREDSTHDESTQGMI